MAMSLFTHRTLVRPFWALMLCLSLLASASLARAMACQDVFLIPPSAEEIVTRLWAVHVQGAPPRGPGISAIPEEGIEIKPGFRVTIHWALGEVVRSHGRNDWTEDKFAILTPLKNLVPQLVNLNPYDTFTVGSFSFTSDTVILAPMNGPRIQLSGVQVHYYDSNKQTLREAVDEFIARKGGWSVKMEDGKANGVARLNGDGIDINSSEFFRSLLQRHPEVSFGSHIQASQGDAWRFGAIEQAVMYLSRPYRGFDWPHETSEIKFFMAFIDHQLVMLSKAFASGKLPRQGIAAVEYHKKLMQRWRNLWEVDLKMRSLYGRTIADAGMYFKDRILKASLDQNELEHVATLLLRELKPYRQKAIDTPTVAIAMASMGRSELQDSRLTEILDNSQFEPRALWILNGIYRFSVIGPKAAADENLTRLLASQIYSLTRRNPRPFDLEAIATVRKALDEWRTFMPEMASILRQLRNDPNVAYVFESAGDLDQQLGFPKAGP